MRELDRKKNKWRGLVSFENTANKASSEEGGDIKNKYNKCLGVGAD